ncbi:MAG: carboxypeptidase-like regulatory domain-containing protein [Bacteroidia bacterium]|nr:carboxypeptidase-like regulatory domain-containing protein [Bacteroidia bacterium]
MKYITSILLVFMICGNCYFISCKKNTECKANITVVDQGGVGVAGASVQLFAVVKTASGSTVTADLKASGETDGGGNVRFTFKLPAIYDIAASKVVNTPSSTPTGTIMVTQTLTGTGIIKLEEGKGVSKTVVIK